MFSLIIVKTIFMTWVFLVVLFLHHKLLCLDVSFLGWLLLSSPKSKKVINLVVDQFSSKLLHYCCEFDGDGPLMREEE